jgi:hypothetical protein
MQQLRKIMGVRHYEVTVSLFETVTDGNLAKGEMVKTVMRG